MTIRCGEPRDLGSIQRTRLEPGGEAPAGCSRGTVAPSAALPSARSRLDDDHPVHYQGTIEAQEQ
jgi:hypothetical protein